MPLKNFRTIGHLQGFEYLTGTITAVYYETDTCDLVAKEITSDGTTISFYDVTYTGVPIFYHCKSDAIERDNGAIAGGAFAFAKDDEVIVLRQKYGAPTGYTEDYAVTPEIFVIGHTSGSRPCRPVVMVFATQSEKEAVAWDVLNDCVIVGKAEKATVMASLSGMGVTTQTECVIDEIKWACPYLNYLQFKRDGCPATFAATANDLVNEPFYAGSTVSRWVGTSISGPGYYDSGGVCTSGYHGYGVPYLYFTNPFPPLSEQPATAIPGPWAAYLYGGIYETVYSGGVGSPGKWDTVEWGVMPYPWDQLYYIQPDTGWTRNRSAISITVIYFRDIFDYKFDYGRVPPVGSASTVLTIPALNLAATELYHSCRDGSIRLLADIDNDVWLEMNLSQGSYDSMVNIDTAFMNPTLPGQVAMHPYFEMPCMVDQADGIATNDKTSLLFEYCGVYPDAYEFYEAEQEWDEAKLAKLKYEFRIYYRHPYPLRNMDAIIFKLVNDERISASKDAFEWNWNLYRAAQRMADDTADNLSIPEDHVASDGSTIEDRAEDAGYAYKYISKPYSINGVPLNPIRQFGGAENLIAGPVGTAWPLCNIVNNTLGDTPIIAAVDKGIEITVEGDGWMQSAGHAANITDDDFDETGVATKRGDDGKTFFAQTFGFTNYGWPGFSSFNPEKLMEYVTENFTFNEDAADTRRKPRVYLCTIPD